MKARRRSSDLRGLDLLRSETNRSVLTALAKQPATEAELKGRLILRDRGKLRRHLETLLAAGAIENVRLRAVRRRVEYRLTGAGEGLVAVMAGVERWLRRHPDRDLEAVSPIGWRAFALLIDAWTSGLAKALAVGTGDPAALAAAIDVSASRLGDDLLALEGAGLVAVAGDGDAGPFYALTEWAARGVGVLALSSHWQRTVTERPVPVRVEDALAALAAALPLAEPDKDLAGSCSLTVEPDHADPADGASGALRAQIDTGRVAVGPARPGQDAPEAWVRGTVGDWLAATVGGRVSALQIGGSRDLAVALLVAVRGAIYGDD
jgi:DNA-binding HxlR family transcriptional regulator